MSSLIVDTCRVDSVRPHPNADRLDIAVIKGWQCVIPKGTRSAGDLVTYIPIDSVLPLELSDALGVTKYLSKGRVRAARLRGEPSYGVVMDARGDEGFNAAESLGITKWLPPVKLVAGDEEPDHPLFPKYTDIENLRNFTNVFEDGEEVIATEKIHGTNSRVGMVIDGDMQTVVIGSKSIRRKVVEGTTYHFPLTMSSVATLLQECINDGAKSAILYGEIYGKVQSLHYGIAGRIGFMAFDLCVDMQYVCADRFFEMMRAYGVPTVPVLYRGPYSIEAIKAASNGRSAVEGADNIREGVVVRPVAERNHPALGRVILKYVGDDYLCANDDDAGE